MQVEKIKTTGLFTNYIYKAIPLAFDESMSYYETLCGLLSYLKDTVVPTLNNNADAIIEVQGLMEKLQTYVDDYFKNLDVQEEINNKLDEMLTSGQLEEIIGKYVTEDIQVQIDNLNTKVDQNKQEIDKKIDNILNEEIIIVGDSYLTGQGLDNPSTENFGYILMQKLGLDESKFHICGEGGSSFTNAGNQGRTWIQIVEEKSSEVSANNITKIIFAGGYNDINATNPQQIDHAMELCVKKCKELFPNAKIYIDLIGNNGATTSAGSNARNLLKNRIYNVYSKCYKYGAIFIDKGQLALQNYTLYENHENKVHPNSTGQQEIANWLYQQLVFGSCDYSTSINAYNATTPSGMTGSLIIAEKLLNNTVDLKMYSTGLIKSLDKGEVLLNLGVQNLNLIRNNNVSTGNTSTPTLIRIGNNSSNTYHTVSANCYVNANNELIMSFENEFDSIDKIILNWVTFKFDVSNI